MNVDVDGCPSGQEAADLIEEARANSDDGEPDGLLARMATGLDAMARELAEVKAWGETAAREREELRVELARSWAAVGAYEERVSVLSGQVDRVRMLADQWERGATRWADPLPVPDEVTALRQALA